MRNVTDHSSISVCDVHVWLLIAALAACGTSKSEDKKAARDFKVTLDGKEVRIKTARAEVSAYGGVVVDFSSEELVCKEKPAPRDGEVRFLVYLNKLLKPDGKLEWVVHEAETEGSSTELKNKPPVSNPDVTQGGTFPLKLDLEVGKLVVKGTREIVTCKVDDPAPEGAPTGAVMTVAGKEIPITSALLWVHKNGERDLVLNNLKQTNCIPHALPGVQLTMTWVGEAMTTQLDGEWLSKLETEDARLTATPNQPNGGETKIKIELGGSTKLGDYSVALKGTAEVPVCKGGRGL
jgi:hypothetical protein